MTGFIDDISCIEIVVDPRGYDAIGGRRQNELDKDIFLDRYFSRLDLFVDPDGYFAELCTFFEQLHGFSDIIQGID